MKKIIEKLIYSLGRSFSFYDVDKEMAVLEKNLPFAFKRRQVIDIGCGDGTVTMKLKKVLAPQTLLGLDIYPALVKRARSRGVTVEIRNVEKETPAGDLGILWGVLHHFTAPADILRKIHRNFRSLIIRECLNERRFDLGHQLNRQQFISIIQQAGIELSRCQLVESPLTRSLIVLVDYEA